MVTMTEPIKPTLPDDLVALRDRLQSMREYTTRHAVVLAMLVDMGADRPDVVRDLAQRLGVMPR